MNTRETYHHGDLRMALIEAGLRRLSSEGQESISLRSLAKEAGVSPNAPYRHFADKHALMAALAADGFRRFADEMESRSRPESTPIGRLWALGEAYVDFARAQGALYRLMFSPYGYSLQDAACGLHAERAFSLLVQATREAQESGWRASHNLHAVAVSYWAFLHGWAALLSDQLLPPDVATPRTTDCLTVFFDGPKG